MIGALNMFLKLKLDLLIQCVEEVRNFPTPEFKNWFWHFLNMCNVLKQQKEGFVSLPGPVSTLQET